MIAASADPHDGVLIVLGAMTLTGTVVSAWITTKARGHAKEAATAARTGFEQAVGIPNGHGTLMNQSAIVLQNQLELSNQLHDHVLESTKDRLKIHADIRTVTEQLGAVSDTVGRHIEWEETSKYWDGKTERRTP